MTSSRRAFSLIEVILVIVIISLLGGIAFAAMGPARENARQRVCVSNLRQIGHALAMYAHDYDGVEPISGVPMSCSQLGLPSIHRSFSFIDEYVKNRALFLCPSYHRKS